MILDDYAQSWARTIIDGLNRPFPWGSAHQSSGPDDVDVTPWRLHPCFHGCLDWHSSAHMQWSALTLIERAHQAIDRATIDELTGILDARLTDANAHVEAEYLRTHRGYERPYGWGWAALLSATCAASTVSTRHLEWASATAIIGRQVFDNLLTWLPTMTFPVRTGTHDNTAFGIGLCLDAARSLERRDIVEAIIEHSHRFFDADVNYPSSWEPSGNDFLSAALSEAHLMARVYDAEGRSDEFGAWLHAFLPHLGHADDTLLDVPEVTDGTDGKLAHLYGLSLSRAWQLRALTTWLDDDARRRIETATQRQISKVAAQITDGDFMATHWLVSFALQAVMA
ncbi:DUF2891 domain-containing protein [Cutibacterium sp. WCA-380-WT-3A]|uniref:DUF2891 domain-containing protein n=1 Tax=Cutibacterium porci TaxID=2605781 RepID=A0A7K0J554_9ACTN|nr:DUF2891 family protein [Cutibacterium porci]MSS44968.1 DUF2891 domain-containing protein [Cutibacterium porci]